MGSYQLLYGLSFILFSISSSSFYFLFSVYFPVLFYAKVSYYLMVCYQPLLLSSSTFWETKLFIGLGHLKQLISWLKKKKRCWVCVFKPVSYDNMMDHSDQDTFSVETASSHNISSLCILVPVGLLSCICFFSGKILFMIVYITKTAE